VESRFNLVGFRFHGIVLKNLFGGFEVLNFFKTLTILHQMSPTKGYRPNNQICYNNECSYILVTISEGESGQMPAPEWFNQKFEVCCNEETYVHESAYIDEPCEIGHGTSVMHFSHISANTVIGAHCQIGQNVTIASGVFIGDNVRVLNNTLLNSGVILENDVYCGPSTVFAPLKYIRGEAGNVSSIQPTLVKRGASIGANTTIASGFTIGQFTFVESGSVVDRNVPDFAVVYGNPIQFAAWRCECGQTIKFRIAETTVCSRCGKKYARQSETEIVQLSAGGTTHDSHIQSHSTIPHFKTFN
jgi:UDP-2-acetamido-3-amino-2,3-dideoxy-glucuronate N-acetyltransferase